MKWIIKKDEMRTKYLNKSECTLLAGIKSAESILMKTNKLRVSVWKRREDVSSNKKKEEKRNEEWLDGAS